MNYYNEIKEQIINNEITKKVKDYSKNRSDLETYYNIGKLLKEAGKHYGEGIIKEYSEKLSKEINKKYNTTTLKRMRQFYVIVEKGATVWHQLSWSHYRILITLNSIDKINYYSKVASENLYSVRQLQEKIANNEYGRLDENTKLKLINKDEPKVEDFIKNPIPSQFICSAVYTVSRAVLLLGYYLNNGSNCVRLEICPASDAGTIFLYDS